MKKIKRMLCMVFAIALLFAMATAASAATLIFAKATVSVTKNSTHTVTTMVCDVPTAHVRGTADTIPYCLDEDQTFHELNIEAINQDFRAYILTTYLEEGFERSVAVDASGEVTVPAGFQSGVYAVILSYTYGTATWEVEQDSEIVDCGYISEAPISMSIAAVMQ